MTPVPLPSLAEQHQVAGLISKALTHSITLTSELEIQWQRAIALRQSILKRASSGQLVPQDANDEPAKQLLERIKAEKEDSGDSRKKNNKNNSKKEAA